MATKKPVKTTKTAQNMFLHVYNVYTTTKFIFIYLFDLC